MSNALLMTHHIYVRCPTKYNHPTINTSFRLVLTCNICIKNIFFERLSRRMQLSPSLVTLPDDFYFSRGKKFQTMKEQKIYLFLEVISLLFSRKAIFILYIFGRSSFLLFNSLYYFFPLEQERAIISLIHVSCHLI